MYKTFEKNIYKRDTWNFRKFRSFHCFIDISTFAETELKKKGTMRALKMHVEEGDIRDGNSKQKTEIPASGAPVGRAAHARLITILFDSSPPP